MRQYYYPDHFISLQLLHRRISAKPSSGSLTIFILHLSRFVVFGANLKNLSHFIWPTASFPTIFFNAWLIILSAPANTVSSHLFNLSSQLIFLGAPSKAPLSRCLEMCTISNTAQRCMCN